MNRVISLFWNLVGRFWVTDRFWGNVGRHRLYVLLGSFSNGLFVFRLWFDSGIENWLMMCLRS